MKKIFFVGDSLSANYNIEAYPQTGYAEEIRAYKADDVVFVNLARGGCSTKSFIDQGRFNMVEDSISAGDLLIVQFGHNDEKEYDPSRYTRKEVEFVDNLQYFYDAARKNNALCVFATSPTRMIFEKGKIKDTHLGYPEAMLDFCKNRGYVCVDLNRLTTAHYNQIGEEQAKKYHLIYPEGMYARFPDGSNDTTHYNQCGAKMVAKLFLTELQKEFAQYDEYFVKYRED